MRQAADRPQTWEGGRIKYDATGAPSFIIQRMVKGRRYYVTTPATTRRAALVQLERFEADPEAYDPRGHPTREAIYLTPELSQEYLDYSAAKGNSRPWRQKQKAILKWWGLRLERVDLRRVSMQDHLLPALRAKGPPQHHRTAVLKGLFTWLRTEAHRITTAEDPVFGQVKVPQQRAAQLRKSKVIPREHVELVLEHLTSPWRDALTLQAATGWHTTEIVRFAAEGTIEPLPRHAQQEGVAGVVVCPMRKSGEPQRTRVSQRGLEAAKRLREHGAFSREWYDRAVRSACESVKRPDGEMGIPVFTPGRLRHSVASWAIEAGADPASVAAFLGHRSPRTTTRFYATHASPQKVPTFL